MSIDLTINADLAGVRIPDSKLARQVTELERDVEPALPLQHSRSVSLQCEEGHLSEEGYVS